MVNNFTNISKANNHLSPLTSHLSPQIIEHKKDHDMWCWKSRSWVEKGTKNVFISFYSICNVL